MALLKSYYEDKYELTIDNCYWKIDVNNGIMGGKNKLDVMITAYKDKASADLDKNRYGSHMFTFTPNVEVDSPNFLQQAYTYAKTLPMFENAVDA